MQDIKKKVSFLDAEGHRCTIEAEITHRNGYAEFTASGTYPGHAGQCLDSMKPATEAQKKLIRAWHLWHLNGMHAGTQEQEQAIREEEERTGQKMDYDAIKTYLKSIKLEPAEGPDGQPYEYGSKWLKESLPADYDIYIINICNTINQEEADRAEKAAAELEDSEDEEDEDGRDKKLKALMDEEDLDEDQEEACRAYLDAYGVEDLSGFAEAYQGQYSDDEDFARETAESMGLIDDNASWPNNCIDWEDAARDLMQDYTEQDGYYFRNY